jgi:hypothetical protein
MTDHLAEATQAPDWRSVRRLVLGVTAWFTVQIGFAAWLAVTMISAWSVGGSIRIAAVNVGLTWLVADVVILAVLIAHIALRHLVEEPS